LLAGRGAPVIPKAALRLQDGPHQHRAGAPRGPAGSRLLPGARLVPLRRGL